MVVCFFSKYCEYCKAIERDALNDKEISGTLKKEVIYLISELMWIKILILR